MFKAKSTLNVKSIGRMQPGVIMISGMVCLAVSAAMSITTSAPDHPSRRPFDRYSSSSTSLPPSERRNRQTPMFRWSMLTPLDSDNDEPIEAAISVPQTTSLINTTEAWNSADSKLTDRKKKFNKERSPKALFNRLQPLNYQESSLDDDEEDEGPSSVEIVYTSGRLNLPVENTPFISNMNMYDVPTGRDKAKTPKKGSRLDWKHESSSKATSEERMRENPFVVGKVPELQVGCEGFADFSRSGMPSPIEARAKRFVSDSIRASSTSGDSSNYTVRIISREDDYYEYDYEEMDELVRLRELFGSTQGPRRGDIQIKIDSYASLVPEEPPKRGDLGKSSVVGAHVPVKSSEAPISRIESKPGGEMTSDSLSSSVESFVKNSDSSEKVSPNEMRSNVHRRSSSVRSKRSALWGFGNDDGEIGSSEFEDKREEEEHERQKLLDYAHRRRPDDARAAAKVEVQSHRRQSMEKRENSPHTGTMMPNQTKLNEKSASRVKSDRNGQEGTINTAEWKSERKIDRRLLEYVNRNRPVILDGPELRSQKVNEAKGKAEQRGSKVEPEIAEDNHGEKRRIGERRKTWSTDAKEATEKGDAWRDERARRRRLLPEERKLQDYIRRNQPVGVPRQAVGGSTSNGINLMDKRRRTGVTRYHSAVRSDKRNHGPSAPTIDFYPRYDHPRYEPSRAGTARETTEQEEEEKRRTQEGQRYHVTEERRREAEYRRQQSRSYEENRGRRPTAAAAAAATERPEVQGKKGPTESSSGTLSENLDETNKRITDDRRRPRPDRAREDPDFERQAGEEKRLAERKQQQDHRLNPRNRPIATVGRVAPQSWRQREDARLNSLPVSARIILQPPPTRREKISSATVTSRMNGDFGNDINFPGINPYQRGVEAAGFPVHPTSRPPIASPSPCVWAIVQCCPSSGRGFRLVTCFESLGCLGANWTPNPCNGAIAQAARMEIAKFYADVDAYKYR